MKRNDPTFKELVARIQSGELTREQAADAYGIKPGTLNVWLVRSKVGESTRMKGRQLHGAAAELADSLDPEIAKLIEEATQKVLDGTFKSCLAASKAYPNIVLGTLTTRVRKARLAQGLPIGRQGKAKAPKTDPKTLETIGFPVELR